MITHDTEMLHLFTGHERKKLGARRPRDGTLHAPTSLPLARPIDVDVNPADSALYILDFGLSEMDGPDGLVAGARTGRILRVVF